MESTVSTLEAMFQKAESDLNYLSRKLEFEFGKDDPDGAQVNPVKMMQKIAEIKKEYASLVGEAAAIQKAQMEAMDFFRSNLLMACGALQKIQQQTGTWDGEKPQEIIELETLFGVHAQQPEICTNEESVPEQERTVTCQTIPQQSQSGVSSADCPEPDVSPATRRKKSKEYVEISEHEFESISSLVRGRVKLSEVNSTYSTLWTHFKEGKRKDPLAPSEMHKMGMKVTGATGEAKLKVLRALKLLTIDSKGAVKLV